MQRMLEPSLLTWKNNAKHMPLLIRGARQVGKSYLIESFGKKYFKNLVSINFETQFLFKQVFKSLDPKFICESLSLRLNQAIIPGQTLLFLDEIQECPEAIQALRYFKEAMPELHVIGAASLLEFVLNQEDFRMPVGRVQNLYLKPLSFQEFLLAIGNALGYHPAV